MCSGIFQDEGKYILNKTNCGEEIQKIQKGLFCNFLIEASISLKRLPRDLASALAPSTKVKLISSHVNTYEVK